MRITEEVRAGLEAKFADLLPHLDERATRLYLASEARALGYGGIRAVALAAEKSQATVLRGVRELEGCPGPIGRVRAEGGGRRPLTERDPGLLDALNALVQPQEAGDPVSPLRWTTLSLRDLAETLTADGHPVSAPTVGHLLHQMGFSLQGTAKVKAGAQHPDRDAQFRHINTAVERFQAEGQPVISVDAKKKEAVGNLDRPGRSWRPKGDPVTVADHTFADQSGSLVTPFGIYDIAHDSGWVNVGTDHSTAQFAVESIRRWWDARGHLDYPGASQLLITADAGGGNDHRSNLFKHFLADFAHHSGLAVTVAHFPPGTSKWNKIEHRLFSRITHNWRGYPLTSHEVVVQSIASTRTRTGLSVQASLDTNNYPTGLTLTKAQIAALPITRDTFHGEWNYRIDPTGPLPAPPPAPAIDPAITTLLNAPELTGMSREDFQTLVSQLAPGWDALAEALHHQRTGRPRTRRSTPGRGRIDCYHRILTAVLRARKVATTALLAKLMGTDPGNLFHMAQDAERLLALNDITIPPAHVRKARTLNQLRALTQQTHHKDQQ